MLSFTQDRLIKYPVVVRAKVSETQKHALERLSKRTNRHVSEVIRDAIQAAIDEAGTPGGKAESEDIQTCLELLQVIRMEQQSGFSCMGVDLKVISGEAEEVAAADLAALRARIARRAMLRRSLAKEDME